MSTTVFPFTIFGDMEYGAMFETNVAAGNGGVFCSSPEYGPEGLYKSTFQIIVPYNGQTVSTWLQFIKTMQGGYDSFLLKEPLTDFFRKSTLEALGTGTGLLTDFALDFKHVDELTLHVFVNGSESADTNWDVIDNHGTPLIRFNVAPANGFPITATYEYHLEVVFDGDPSAGQWFPGPAEGLEARRVSVRELWSGVSKAA